jgi:sugar phosphate permease
MAAGLSAIGALSLLRIRPRPPQLPQPTAPGSTLTQEYVAALHLLRDSPVVRRLFIGCTLFYLALPLLNFLLPLLTMQTYGLGVQAFGMIDAMFGIGGIAAGVLLHALEERFGHHRMIVGGVIAFGTAILLFPLYRAGIWLIPLYFVVGFFCHSGVGLMSELQAEVPQNMQGRILSMFNTCMSLLATAIVQSLGANRNSHAVIFSYVVYGAVMVGFGLFFLRRWMKTPAKTPAA